MKSNSYKEIIKSTGVIGSSQIITLFIGVIRTKFLAVLLGTTGVGIIGLLQSTLEFAKSITGFGIGFSAIRDISSASQQQDEFRIVQVISIFRKLVWLTGIIGLIVVLIFSRQISIYTFGSDEYTNAFVSLAIVMLFSALSDGQLAILQGLRKIYLLAKVNVYSAILSTISSIALFYFLGINGIVPSIFITSLFTLFIAWFFSNKIKIKKIKLNWTFTIKEGRGMIKLGLFTVITGLLSTGTLFILRIFLKQKGGLELVGLFQAAWTLSSIYISAVLSAMAKDYFPRLSGYSNEDSTINKLVNEQTEITLLVSCPLIIAMLIFSDLLINLFYNENFKNAWVILYWLLAGNLLKILSWPLGFVILAKSKGKLYIFTETTWNILFLIVIYFAWSTFNIASIGIAFIVGYFVYWLILYFVLTNKTLFKYSTVNKSYILFFLICILLTMIISKELESLPKYLIGTIVIIITSTYSFVKIKKIVNLQELISELISRIKRKI